MEVKVRVNSAFRKLYVQIVGKLRRIGSTHYLRIPKSVVEVYELQTGDEVVARLVEVKERE